MLNPYILARARGEEGRPTSNLQAPRRSDEEEHGKDELINAL